MIPSGEFSGRLGTPLWDGRPGRLEVWYATITDAATGTGYWLHYEAVSPTRERPEAVPYAHGWIAVFPPDGAPRCERFGPSPVPARDQGDNWLTAGGAVVGPGLLRGVAGEISWDLSFEDASAPMFTFGSAVWDRRLLPAAQCVPSPDATFRGRCTIDGTELRVEGRGALARIYGHSNAERWCWLHAHLEEGGVLEVVSATARRPSLRRLPPLAMVQLRLPGEPDRPRIPALAAPLLRTRITESGFRVAGPLGLGRLEIDVALPAGRSVALEYTDPDGSTATCTNSEVSDATIVLRRKGSERTWDLRGRAHAEVGRRP